MEERLIKVGITHGDINGIGYEVILKTFSDTRMAELCTPIIYGSSKIAAYHRKALELPPINMNIISHAEDAGVNRVNIINAWRTRPRWSCRNLRRLPVSRLSRRWKQQLRI